MIVTVVLRTRYVLVRERRGQRALPGPLTIILVCLVYHNWKSNGKGSTYRFRSFRTKSQVPLTRKMRNRPVMMVKLGRAPSRTTSG